MARIVSLAMVFHNHQPVGNFGWVIAEAYEHAYLPMVVALERHPGIRVGLHYTGPLLDWIGAERPDFLGRLRDLVARGQVELLGGGYYEPVLASLPERDRIAQLRRMADEVERIGGRRPAGAWLAERVWEPDVPTSIVDAGYRWTILDDAHFRAAALDTSDLWGGAFTTEDQGRLLTVFGSGKKLRYGMPFGKVEEVIDDLLENATEAGDRLGFMGDDGEKFGAWPGTYDYCWGSNGWIERFFQAVEAEAGTIATVSPSDWLAGHPPAGRIYLPTSSYFEMGEWALPADQGLAFEQTAAAAEAAGEPWFRWLHGGFWRNFQVKYREINDLHKQMLRTSGKVAEIRDEAVRSLALDHLHQGQSNDCYWHGVFGGIYLSHMRLATYEHLIAAEDLADRSARGAGLLVDRIALADTDLDGIDEVLATTPGLVVVIDLAEGAGVGSFDVRASRHALTAVMRRRPEAYHARLVASDRAEAAAGGAASRAGGTETDRASQSADADRAGKVATIHEVVRSREPGLAARLHYDGYERRSGLVHLLAPGTDRTTFMTGRAGELGDAHHGRYDLVSLDSPEVVARREVALLGTGDRVRVEKRFTIDGDRRRPGLQLEVTLENRSAGPVRFDLAIEWAITMLGGGGNPAAYYLVGGERLTHDSDGERDHLECIASGNDYVGVRLDTTATPATTTWWSPIETISNSEFGFERVYQGSSLTFVWPTDLEPGGRRTVSVANTISTEADKTDDELERA